MIDCSDHNAQALVTVAPNFEFPRGRSVGRHKFCPMSLVGLVFDSRDAPSPAAAPQKLKDDLLTISSVNATTGGATGSGAGVGRSTWTGCSVRSSPDPIVLKTAGERLELKASGCIEAG